MKLSESKVFSITIIVIVLVQLLLAFQGLDVCDDGFVLSGYQQIFNAPESVEYNFVYWLSTILGGFWYLLFPNGGVLWFKILAIIVNTGTFVLAYKLLKDYMKPQHALIGLAMVLFVNDYGFLVFYHNQLTAFFSVWIAFLLHRGILRQNLTLLFLSGLLVGVNVFTRLPNLSLSVLILAIPLMVFLKKERLVEAFKPSLFFVLGIVIGIGVILLIMILLGQFEIFSDAINTLFNLGKTRGSGHSIIDLVYVFIYNYKKVLLFSSAFLLMSIIFLLISEYLKNRRKIIYVLAIVIFAVFFLFFRSGGIYAVYAISFFGLILLQFNAVKKEAKLLAFIAFLVMVCLPLGSGGGIHSSGYMCIWLAVPLAIGYLFKLKTIGLSFGFENFDISKQFSKETLHKVISVMILAFFCVKAYHVSKEAYFDPGSRLEKTYLVNNNYTKLVYTTKERADIINELLINLDDYVMPNDYLLTFDNIPLVHFLTNTKPYMYNPWVMVYDENSFVEKLTKAEAQREQLPIVVQQKFNTVASFSDPIPNYLNSEEPTGRHYNKVRSKAMMDFLERNDYEIVWSNPYFNILKASKPKP
ncbi:hypothetical protein [Winogradskyella sp. 3972H.M.0a.05]|uniref:hypothetical protein n=1 Tax=Winogradskyella sp. 3972H.M.0a.05 TaxID=2950277 RepID=UPI0033926D60